MFYKVGYNNTLLFNKFTSQNKLKYNVVLVIQYNITTWLQTGLIQQYIQYTKVKMLFFSFYEVPLLWNINFLLTQIPASVDDLI